MRIGLVLPAVPVYSETFFVNKIRGLQLQGHEVVLFVNAATHQKKFENVPIFVAPQLCGNPILVVFCLSFRFLLLLFFHLKKLLHFYRLEKRDESSLFSIVKRAVSSSHILSQKLDWLHFGFGTMALEKENLAEAIEAKMAVSFRGFDHYVYPLKNRNCYKNLFSKRVKYHVLSEGMKNSLVQKGVLKESIVKITPAVDVNLFNKVKVKKSDLIIQMVSTARLHWIKGLEYTLEALALVKQKGIAFHYTIIGEGTGKERLQFATYQLGLQDNVSFVGKLASDEVKDRLEQADLYLQYSIQEGFCNAVLEAQAMGKICIVSDAEGLAENVIDRVTGFVVPKRSPISLADKIIEVIALEENKKNEIQERAINRVKNDFSLEKQQNDFLVFYTID